MVSNTLDSKNEKIFTNTSKFHVSRQGKFSEDIGDFQESKIFSQNFQNKVASRVVSFENFYLMAAFVFDGPLGNDSLTCLAYCSLRHFSN